MIPDYVIVGAGSAGCALAYRLVMAGKRVDIIEYGGSDVGPFIQMPAALSYPMNMRRYDWGFSSEPEPHLGRRRLVTPRGKVVGGSSSINGMVFVRGHARDFDFWAESGAGGWAYADVLPYFKRMESSHGAVSDYRGTEGPLHVTRGSRKNPLFNAFIRAGREAGYPTTEDYNGARQEGFGAMEATIWEGRRWSAANAYLRPAQETGQLRLRRGLAQRVVFEDGRAVGVEVKNSRGVNVFRAKHEVILSASSINTPKLLMLSGIGPAEHLAEHGIAVRADGPGWGRTCRTTWKSICNIPPPSPSRSTSTGTCGGRARSGRNGWRRGRAWAPRTSSRAAVSSVPRRGWNIPTSSITSCRLPCATTQGGGRGTWLPGPCRADALEIARHGAAEIRRSQAGARDPLQLHVASRRLGRVPRLRAADARDLRAAGLCRIQGYEIQPGEEVVSDEQIDAFIREHAESAFHPCGTARMGRADDPMAVVDPELRVIGVEGLRVADSSIFPRITNGNLNAPSIMTGEKAADHILGQGMLAPLNLGPEISPDWEKLQRSA